MCGRRRSRHPSALRVVTDELAPDHLHQSGIFLAYTKTQFEGRDVDFWNLAGGKGRVRFKELKGMSSGPLFGRGLSLGLNRLGTARSIQHYRTIYHPKANMTFGNLA